MYHLTDVQDMLVSSNAEVRYNRDERRANSLCLACAGLLALVALMLWCPLPQ